MNITRQRPHHPVLAGLPPACQPPAARGYAFPARSAAEKCCNGGLCSCVASCDCTCAACVC